MEKVHVTYRRPWISEEQSIQEFCRSAHSSLTLISADIEEERDYSPEERLMRLYDLEELEKREKSCSAALLDCEGEEFIEYCKEFEPPKGNTLDTLKRHVEELDKRNQNHVYRNMVFQTCRYKFFSSNMEVVPRRRKPDSSEPEFVKVKHPEVVLTVQIYRPEIQQLCYQRNNGRIPTFNVDQQFYVLGCQNLTEVRDQIICQSDASLIGEFSDNPSSSVAYTAKDVYKSGFFYINGTFYNDMRDPMNKDYSRQIIEWSHSARDVGPFSVAKMEDTRFMDLNIQLGVPYVYQHQGHCEHMLVFSELRLMKSNDSQNLMDYPLIQILQAKKPVRCMSCIINTTKWITTEDKRLPVVPYFFCDKCFKAFNYDKEGKKIADFKAYKYFDRTAIF